MSSLGHGWLAVLVLVAGCAGSSNSAQRPAPQTAASPPACDVTIYPGAAPYDVEDLGPIQAPCSGSGGPWVTQHWTTCGIDQPNLLQVACSSGADTVFGLYETVGSAAPANDGRVMHARLGKRRHPVAAGS